MLEAILLAAYLHRPPALVEAVFRAGGIDAVAVVEMESNFVPTAYRQEPRGHTSYGLFQIDSEWHPQYRHDLTKHIAEGVRIYRECRGATMAEKVSHFNGGTYPGEYSKAWGRKVMAKRDELRRWLRWRPVREMECVMGREE